MLYTVILSHYMQLLFTSIFLLASLTIFGQSPINRDNYFEYKATDYDVTTAWLTELEVAWVAEALMKEEGFSRTRAFALVEIEPGVIVHTLCYDPEANFGLLYESIHSAFPNEAERALVSLYQQSTGYDYSEVIYSISGESDFVKIKKVPANLFIVKENNYWYQYTYDEVVDQKLVSKEVILRILKADLREVLRASR